MRVWLFAALACLLGLWHSTASAQSAVGLQWRITKLSWSASDEKAYGEFVAAIGNSNCHNVDSCLKGPWNIYRGSDSAGSSFFADCADLPYVLRGYFAWKNGLPFSYASGVAAVGHSRDLRYSRYGNYVFARTDLTTPAEGMAPNGRSSLLTIYNMISSAMYRFAPATKSEQLFDFYPVKLAPGAIRPGTNIYDPNGHVAVVYDVDDEGRIRYIDTHPDNSLTRGSYGKRFVRASAPMGAGFKNWRPQQLVGATRGADGSYIGGRIVLAADNQLPDWSVEQFFGNGSPDNNDWRAAQFVYKGEPMDYYDYVRTAVAGHDIVYDPLVETRNMVRGLCDDLQYRAQAVDISIKAGMNNRPQPDQLPNNIYGTEGDWETYSSPSRDARLKVAFKELKDQVAKFLDMAQRGDKALSYSGSSLQGDLAAAYSQEAVACTVAYQATDGSTRTLSFEEARRRLFLVSFDPYQCVERRWGATLPEELSTCPDGETKRAWYEAEQRLRNQLDRTYDVQMGFSLSDLRIRAPGSGIDTPPDVDLAPLLGNIAVSVPLRVDTPGKQSSLTPPASVAPAETTMDKLARRSAEIASGVKEKISEFIPEPQTH